MRISLRFFIGGLVILPFAIALVYLFKSWFLGGFLVLSLIFFYYRAKLQLDKYLNAETLSRKEVNLPCGWDGTKKFLSKWYEWAAFAVGFGIGFVFGYDFLMMLVLEGSVGMFLGIGWYYLSVERKYNVKLRVYKYE